MSDDVKYTVSNIWTKVQHGGVDVENGTFTIFNLGGKRVEVWKKATIPTEANGTSFMIEATDFIRDTFSSGEFRWVRTSESNVRIGVVKAG